MAVTTAGDLGIVARQPARAADEQTSTVVDRLSAAEPPGPSPSTALRPVRRP